MNLLRRSAYRRRPGIGAWALVALFVLGSKAAAGQSSQQQTPPADSAKVRAQGEESPPRMTPQEVRRYDGAKTLIDWTPEQIQDLPELQGLQPAESQQDLPAILRDVGERVSALFDEFPNMVSAEEVRSGPCDEGLRKKCRVTYRGKFNYLVVRRTEGDALMGEYRTDLKGRPINYRNLGHGRIFLTYGFATTPLEHFHPQNQIACRFRDFGRQMVGGQETKVVGFVEIPGKYAWPTELRRGTAVVPLCLQGLAWIDPTTYQIVRIETFLLAPPLDVGLERETTLVEFSGIHLHQASTALWLPTEVVVDVWLHQRHFHNLHRYSGFKVFAVETRISPVMEK
ncbi:MAG: hypothetical protein ABSH52_12145 [Terriglobia bacterium]